jgi:Mn2+/Fe2+ NRAMP family transporter
MPSDNITNSTGSLNFSIFTYFPIFFLILLIIVFKYDYLKLSIIDKVDNNALFIGLVCITVFTMVFYIQKSVNENNQNPNNPSLIVSNKCFIYWTLWNRTGLSVFFILNFPLKSEMDL